MEIMLVKLVFERKITKNISDVPKHGQKGRQDKKSREKTY